LRQKLNDPLEERLRFLESHREQVMLRDDATVALASLYNLLDRPQQALDLLLSRRFHPWEGGEGAVLRQYTTARILLGQQALASGDAKAAHREFSLAMDTPESLGEAYHLLQAKANVNYWIGRSLRALGREKEALEHFNLSAGEEGDFSEMAVTSHSPLSFYRGLSLRELGRDDDADALFRDLAAFAEKGLGSKARIDYFATSLPNLLVFEEDLQQRRDAEHQLLLALAHHGLGQHEQANRHLSSSTDFNRADQNAADLERQMRTVAAA
jgi:tetratricopeptide (TPR) repeat protein